MTIKTNREWLNWSELLLSYRNSRLPLEEFIREEKTTKNKNIEKVVSLEVARSMRTDLAEMEKEIESRIMYAMNTLCKEDMDAAGLSQSEIKIAQLRQDYPNKRVSEILNVSREYVWMTYQSAVEKVLKYKTLEERDKTIYILSPQQKEIYGLIEQGKSHQEIVEILGIGSKSLTTQKQRIKKKIGKTKTLNKQLQAKCAQN